MIIQKTHAKSVLRGRPPAPGPLRVGLDRFNSKVNMRLKQIRSAAWHVLVICSERGDCELLRFLENLDGQLAADRVRMARLLDRVAEAGPPDNVERSHQVATGIWEFIAGRLRVFWFYDAGRIVVCSHGIVKRTRKAPRHEIERAQRAYADYQAAKAAHRIVIVE